VIAALYVARVLVSLCACVCNYVCIYVRTCVYEILYVYVRVRLCVCVCARGSFPITQAS